MPGSSLRGCVFTRVFVMVALAAPMSAPGLALAQEPADAAEESGELDADTPGGSSEDADAPEPESMASRGPAVEVETAKRVRHNWYIGFGVGLGAGNLRRTEAGTNTVSVALLGHLRAGARIRDNLLVGGLLSSTLGGARRGQGLLSALAEVIGYPIKGRGLVLQGAAGVGTYFQAEVAPDPTMMATNAATFSRAVVGLAFGLGLGYEFWIARRFNLGLMVRADGLVAPQFGLRTAGTVGLTFTWY